MQHYKDGIAHSSSNFFHRDQSLQCIAIVGNLFGVSDPPHFGGGYKQQSFLH